MAVIEIDTMVNAPVEKVFGFIDDPKRHHEWVPGIVSVEVTPGRAGRVGEIWTMVYSSGGMRSKVKATILEFDENKRIEWDISGAMMEGHEVQVYQSVGTNVTKVSLRNEFRLKGFMRILAPLMVPMMKRGFHRGTENMKRICEEEA